MSLIASAKSLIASAKHTIWKYLGAAFLEPKDGTLALSLGRVSCVAVLAQAMWIWRTGVDIPTTMAVVLTALLGYIGVGKVVEAIRGKTAQ